MKGDVVAKVAGLLGSDVVSSDSLGGGCIADARRLTLKNGRILFCKSGTSADSFEKEAHGLMELAKPGVIKVPEVIFFDEEILLLEYIQQGRRNNHFFHNFGEALARLHQYKGERFGFYEDNFIGATVQLNDSEGSLPLNWATFYFKKRIYYQYELAVKNGYDDGTLRRLISKLEDRIESMIGDDEAPALLHGDLWGGNFMVSGNGEAVLIDPAVYYGHREADLAMTTLFGGFDHAFYVAYQQQYPLKPGWEYREGLYQLYHVLNHLNLFGSGYYSQSIALLKRYV